VPTAKPAAAAKPERQFELPAVADDAADISVIPETPPPDALREVDRAAERAEELWHDKRELHFAMDEDSKRVIVQVRDLDGRVIRTIPPSEALDVLSGKPL
jgi:FlaG protein